MAKRRKQTNKRSYTRGVSYKNWTEEQWKQSYQTFLLKREKLSEKLGGNIAEVPSLNRYKQAYELAKVQFKDTNTMAHILRSQEMVSYKQAKTWARMAKKVKKRIQEGDDFAELQELSVQKYAKLDEDIFNVTIDDFRQHNSKAQAYWAFMESSEVFDAVNYPTE